MEEILQILRRHSFRVDNFCSLILFSITTINELLEDCFTEATPMCIEIADSVSIISSSVKLFWTRTVKEFVEGDI